MSELSVLETPRKRRRYSAKFKARIVEACQHARDFLGDWQGKLICDDYGGYKQSFPMA